MITVRTVRRFPAFFFFCSELNSASSRSVSGVCGAGLSFLLNTPIVSVLLSRCFSKFSTIYHTG